MKSNIGLSNGGWKNFIVHTISWPGAKVTIWTKKCQNGLEVLENIFHPISDYSKVHKRKCLIRLFSPKSQSGTRDFKVCNVYF